MTSRTCKQFVSDMSVVAKLVFLTKTKPDGALYSHFNGVNIMNKNNLITMNSTYMMYYTSCPLSLAGT